MLRGQRGVCFGPDRCYADGEGGNMDTVSETISVRFLADFLNETLATERTLAALYRAALARTADKTMRRHFERFRTEAKGRADVLCELIAKLHGEPGRPPAGTDLLLESMVAAMAAPVAADFRQWKDLEVLLGAALICQRNWQILQAVGQDNGDPHIQKAVRQVIDEVDEQVEHVRQAVLERAPLAVLAG